MMGGRMTRHRLKWKTRISGGRKYEKPITALDIFPTALAAAGVEDPSPHLDGVNLLPFLDVTSNNLPHQTLFWRYACGDGVYGYAVRDGNYKLVFSVYKNKHLLFDLSADPWERNDLAAGQPEIVKRMQTLYSDWSDEMVEPKWLDPHGPNVRKEEAKRQAAVEAASRGDKSK